MSDKQLVNLNLDADTVKMLDEMVRAGGQKCRRPKIVAPLIRQAYRRWLRRMAVEAFEREDQKDGNNG